jgi:two-component system, response regulator YesN
MARISGRNLSMGGTGRDVRILEAIDYIRRNLSKKTTQRDIACRINLSEYYIGEYFKSHTGIGLSVFMKAERFERAKCLLTTSFMSVKEISYAVGFGHAANFDRAFKKKSGISPSAYRKKFQRNGCHRVQKPQE